MRIIPLLAALGAVLPAMAETSILHEEFETLPLGALPTEQALSEGGRLQIFNPEFADQVEIQSEFVHSGKQALTLRRNDVEGTPVVFLADVANFQPLPGTVYRLRMNFLRPTESIGGGTKVNFGGSAQDSAGWMINAIKGTFQFWNGEGTGKWEDTGVPAPVGEWIALTLTLRIEEIDGQLSGSYEFSAESDLQGEEELAKNVPMGKVNEGTTLRLFLMVDKPLPGREASATHWDNLSITEPEE